MPLLLFLLYIIYHICINNTSIVQVLLVYSLNHIILKGFKNEQNKKHKMISFLFIDSYKILYEF
jgi:hypothetical protein